MLVSAVAVVVDEGVEREVSVLLVVTVELSLLVVSLLLFPPPQPIEKAIKAKTPIDMVIFFIINVL
jgi:hypothetical protein